MGSLSSLAGLERDPYNCLSWSFTISCNGSLPTSSEKKLVYSTQNFVRSFNDAQRTIQNKLVYRDPRNPMSSDEISMWISGLKRVGELWILVVLSLDLELEDIYGVSRVFGGGLEFLKSFGFFAMEVKWSLWCVFRRNA
ncbi:hypothetical protein QYF36_022861 [Acer negundo]|nr:hypothetical protein QYF36_022861 [Acer negundo]